MPNPAPKYFKAWIIYFLIATVGGAIIGGLVGGMLGFALGVAQVNLNTIKLITGALGVLIGVPLSYFTFRWVVAEFIVKPLTTPPPVANTPEPPRV